MKRNILTTALAVVVCSSAAAGAPPSASRSDVAQPDIVLVHGAFVDASSWARVIAILQAKGYHVVAVQNPLTSLADDVAATELILKRQTGPVVLVGHSWAGAVITQVGNAPNVRALVYVSASAPDDGQSIADAAAGFPPAPWEASAIRDGNGFLSLPAETVARDFAPDLSPAEQGVIAATQVPWSSSCIAEKVTHAAWHEKPSWWVIGERDRMIAPELQAKMAAAIQAKVTMIPTSHVAMLADPEAVTAVIIAAAERVRAEKLGGPHTPADAEDRAASAGAVDPPPSAPASGAAEDVTARSVRGPAGVVPLTGEPPVRLVVDPPLAGPLALGRVVIQYRAENLRIEPVFGPAALDVSPRIGHIHVTVDDAPWHWLDASGEPLTITGLPPGTHTVLIELVNAVHQTLDYKVLTFGVTRRSLTAPDPKADGFRSAPDVSGDHR